MAINVVSVQYNGGFLPDIILLTHQGYYLLRGTHLNVVEDVLFLQSISPYCISLRADDTTILYYY